jgi:hypothetical protein
LKDEARGAGEVDSEGRMVVSRVNGVRLVSVYLPSGSSGEHRQAENLARTPQGLVPTLVSLVAKMRRKPATPDRDGDSSAAPVSGIAQEPAK